jgi:Uma2 family endonuclease
MSTLTATNWLELAERITPERPLTLPNVAWDEYEELLEQVGEPAGLRISYDEGRLKVVSLSTEHEKYVRFLESLIASIRIRLRLNIVSFGSATIKNRRAEKGNEPDACFYVQTAPTIGNRIQLDFAIDPPPDIAVEVDVHHDSDDKFSIYAALGVSEVWLFDRKKLTIYLLQHGQYVESDTSRALPMLSSRVLTDFLRRLPVEGEFQALLAFDEWLQSLQP